MVLGGGGEQHLTPHGKTVDIEIIILGGSVSSKSDDNNLIHTYILCTSKMRAQFFLCLNSFRENSCVVKIIYYIVNNAI